MVASESFTDAFKRAREEKPGFVEGGQASQGINPAASLGYQAGNIANQPGVALNSLKSADTARAGVGQPQELSQVNPVAQGIADYAASISPEEAAARKSAKANRDAKGFIRQPPMLGPRATGMDIGAPSQVVGPAATPPIAQPATAVPSTTASPSVVPSASAADPPIQIPKPPDAGTSQPKDPVVLPGPQVQAMPSNAVGVAPTTTQPAVTAKPVAAPAVTMPGATVPLSMANPANDPALYDTNRTTGPIMLTNVGPGNAGGKALGDVAAFKTANALEGSRPPSGPATEIPAGSLRQVGNLDVSFSPETTPEQRQAFMEDPVRPTAQINRFNNANSLAGLTQGQRASMNADKVINGGVGQSLASVTMPAQYSPTGPSATWKQAAAKDSKVIANAAERRDARNAVRTGIKERELDIVEQKAIADTENAAAGRDIQGLSLAASVANNQANQQFNSERLKNDKARTDSLKALNQGKLAQVDTINKLQQEYLSPDTDPKRKSAIATELRTLANKDEKKDNGEVPTYVKPEFDKKGVQRPGTGRFVYPPGYIDDLFGDGFNKDDASPEQMSVLLDLAKNDPDLYKTLKSKFN